MPKFNLPGVHGGVSQQSPNLRLQNQHSAASNVLFDILRGIRAPRWGTYLLGVAPGDMTSIIGDIQTSDGIRWAVNWDGTSFRITNVISPVLSSVTLTPPAGYLPADYTRILSLPILDTMILLNKDKPVATAAVGSDTGVPWAYVYIPQVYEGLGYSVSFTVRTTKAVTGVPAGTTIASGTYGATVAAGEYPADIIGDLVTNLVTDTTYVEANSASPFLLRLALKAAALPMEPEITIDTSNSSFDVRGYNLKKAPELSTLAWVTTTPSYEKLPPNISTGVTFEVSEGYYVKFNGVSYEETVCPGHNIKLDKSTMPHELRYTVGVGWSFSSVDYYDDYPRRVGDSKSAPTPEFVGKTLNNLFFYRNRLCFLSDNYVALSKTSQYYDWFPGTSSEVLDDDPIVVYPAALKYSELLWAVPYNKQLILMSQDKQYVLHSGYEALSPTTVAIDEATSYFLNTKIPPIVLDASMILPLDNNPWLGVLEYRLNDQEIATEGTLLSSNVPQYLPVYTKRMIHLPGEHLILFLTGTTEIIVFKYHKQADGSYSQMAWSTWVMPVAVEYAVVLDGTQIVFIGDDNSFLLMNTSIMESIPSLDYRQTRAYRNGDPLVNTHADTVISQSTYNELSIVDDKVVFDYPEGLVVCWTGKKIPWSVTLSPLILRDNNGLPLSNVSATIENMQFDWVGGDFDVTLSGPELPTRTRKIIPRSYTMERKDRGDSVSEPRPTRVLVMSPAKRTTVTLSGSGYQSVQVNNISYNLDTTKDWG